MSLIDATFGLGLPGTPGRKLGDVRPFVPARNGRAALLSRAARASGDGRVTQRGCKIATNPATSLAKEMGEKGLGSVGNCDDVLPCRNQQIVSATRCDPWVTALCKIK
jgi:hypothetical protein